MKPFPRKNLTRKQTIFNYRLSRARRVIENTFGILASRFRVLRAPMCLRVDNAIAVTKATIALHNFLLSVCKPYYLRMTDFTENDQGLPKFKSEDDMQSTTQVVGNRSGNSAARKQREVLSDYFWDKGSVPFQWGMVGQ